MHPGDQMFYDIFEREALHIYLNEFRILCFYKLYFIFLNL